MSRVPATAASIPSFFRYHTDIAIVIVDTRHLRFKSNLQPKQPIIFGKK